MSSNIILSQEIAALSPRALKEGIKNNEERGHIAIYNHIHHRIIPNIRGDSIPPEHVLAYAVRVRLLPTVLIEEIPEVLRYLAHLDCVRQTAVRQIQGLLASDNEYRRRGLANTLTFEERTHVEDVAEGIGEEMRSKFREIVCGFCLYHVYEIWAREEDVDDLLVTYFPISTLWNEDVSNVEKRYLIHLGLTDPERKELEATAQVYLDLLEKFLEDAPPKLSPENFRAQYPRPKQADPSQLTNLVISYLDQLEKAVQTVNNILP